MPVSKMLNVVICDATSGPEVTATRGTNSSQMMRSTTKTRSEGEGPWFWPRYARWVVSLVIAVLVIWAFALLLVKGHQSLGSALEIGSDEHYEVTKALLWVRGLSLYANVWSDQPPLYTVLLGSCFRYFGESIGIARTVAAAFALLLLVICGLLAKHRGGSLAGVFAILCLLLTPHFLGLGVSAMLEMPAITLSLAACWPLFHWQRNYRWYYVAFSGVLIAVALQFKLTAVVSIPALLVETIVGAKARVSVSGHGRVLVLQSVAIWIGATLCTYAVLAILFGIVPAEVLWACHFSAAMRQHVRCESVVSFLRALWLDHFDGLLLVVAAFIVLTVLKDWEQVRFPTIWLLTAVLIHLYHCPWWPYYYLHFAVPLAWLSGYGIAEVLRVA